MRAQTTLDFAIGISLFLITTAFVFTFIPGLIEPFEAGPQEETVVADRVASQLVGGMLGDPAEPNVLDTACTTEFFNATPRTDIDCRFDQQTDLTGSGTIEQRLGVSDRQRVYVELVADTDGDGDRATLCSDGSRVAEPDDGFGGSCTGTNVLLAVGDEPPGGSESIVVARRLAYLDAKEVNVVVRSW